MNVEVVVLNCQKPYQCLKGQKSLGCSLNVNVKVKVSSSLASNVSKVTCLWDCSLRVVSKCLCICHCLMNSNVC